MEELEHYNDIRAAGLLDWHPSKREMLITTRFGDVPQIHHVAMPGGARTQLTFFPDRTASARYRSRSGDVFVFSKDTGGGEFYQLYRFDIGSGAITLLTDGHSRNTGALWSDDGQLLAYCSELAQQSDTDGRRDKSGRIPRAVRRAGRSRLKAEVGFRTPGRRMAKNWWFRTGVRFTTARSIWSMYKAARSNC